MKINRWANQAKKAIKKNDKAVVGVVSAVLLIALLVIVIAIIQIIYIPEIMEQREAEHMDMVALQFSFLTSVIDRQAEDGRRGIPIATSITLGNRELPFLVSSKAFGSLEIVDDSFTVTIRNKTNGGSLETSIFNVGSVRYSSSNAYFLDQSYTYEAGSMIVSQFDGNMMMIPASFYADCDWDNSTITISFEVVNISSVGQKVKAFGYGTYPIQTEFSAVSIQQTFYNVSDISLTTSYVNSWRMFVNRSLKASELLYKTHYLLFETTNTIIINFINADVPQTVHIDLKIIDIKAQIGPGWVE